MGLQFDRSQIPNHRGVHNTTELIVAVVLLVLAACISYHRAINSGYNAKRALVLTLSVHFLVILAAAWLTNRWSELYYGANVHVSQTTWIYQATAFQKALVLLLVMIPVPMLLCYMVTASSQRRQQPQVIVYRS